MKFNIVSVRSDTIDVSGSFYDCPSKNAFTLKKVDGNLKWMQYKTKPRDPKAQIHMGGDYGLVHIDHPSDLFSFEKEQIEKLNELDISYRRSRSSKKHHTVGREFHDLLSSLRSQIREFVSGEIKKLGVSGECLISSDYWMYPTRRNPPLERLWPSDELKSAKDTSPFIPTTNFGIVLFQFNNRKEGIGYIEEFVDYTRRDDWYPRVVVW